MRNLSLRWSSEVHDEDTRDGKEGAQRRASSTGVVSGREYGVSEATFYVWKKKYNGLALNELREENGKLKQLVADLSLDRHLLQKT